jgi:aryl-alcohol dehydrogenase-like predicted oxidoreductase
MDGSPEYLHEACDLSLQRLGIECIDIIVLCRLDPNIPIEDSVTALADLVRRGKAKSIGLSEVSARTIRRAQAIHPISAVEVEFSLWERHVEAEILPTARELGIGIIAHTPLGRGFLTGRFGSAADLAPDDQRRHHPRFEGANFEHNKRLVDGIDVVARRHSATKAQIALAWLLNKGDDIVPVPGSRLAQRIQENTKSPEVRLTSTDVACLDKLFAPQEVSGLRQAPFYLAAVDES